MFNWRGSRLTASDSFGPDCFKVPRVKFDLGPLVVSHPWINVNVECMSGGRVEGKSFFLKCRNFRKTLVDGILQVDDSSSHIKNLRSDTVEVSPISCQESRLKHSGQEVQDPGSRSLKTSRLLDVSMSFITRTKDLETCQPPLPFEFSWDRGRLTNLVLYFLRTLDFIFSHNLEDPVSGGPSQDVVGDTLAPG